MLSKVLRLGFIFLFSLNTFAGKIDKAYEALKIYDYFKAKSLFQELLEDEPVAARYGLCTIYYRNDNPFHNLDTAYAYINIIKVDFENLRSKEKESLLEFSINKESIANLEQDIVHSFWNEIKDTKSVKTLNSFIKQFPNYKDIEKVKEIRTNLAYANAVNSNTFTSYRDFFLAFPDDPRSKEAKEIYEKKLYEAKTHDGDLQSYIDFAYIYPESPYIDEVEDVIYKLSTKKRTAKSYKWFVDNFPENKHSREAWKNLFVLSFTDFNDVEIREFIQKNHDFPYPKIFSESRVLRDLVLIPISENYKWGYANIEGKILIDPQYEFENEFSNEFALVANEEYVGYIDKKGVTVIDFKFDDGGDFIEGVANVTRGDSVALINKLGDPILGYKYSEISDAKDGIVVAKKIKDGKYVYYNLRGENIFGEKEFDFAETFKDSLAIVAKDSNYGVIDLKGNEIIEINNLKIVRDTAKRFKIQNKEEKFGLISIEKQDTIIPFEYDEIGKCSDNKYAIFIGSTYGYVDFNGNKITKLSYKRFKGDLEKTEFRNGYALTNYRGKYGTIDSLGRKVFPNIFEEIGEIIDYPVPCKKRGKWGYVTKKITLWLPYKYTHAGAFKNKIAIVSKNNKYGIIDSRKKVVIPFKYSKITRLENDLFLVSLNKKLGIIDISGKTILPLMYSKIKTYKGNILELHIDGSVHYYNIERKMFLYGHLPK